MLDAGLAGFVSGFRIDDDHLEPIAGSTRALGLANTNPPFFLSSPAQVGFTPDGRHLLVTTKTFNMVDVFAVDRDGQLSAEPVRDPSRSPRQHWSITSSPIVLSTAAVFFVNIGSTIRCPPFQVRKRHCARRAGDIES